MKSPTTESHLTTPLRRPRGRRLRRGGCLLRVLLVLVVLGGGGALALKLFGNDILPPLVDTVRGVVGPEAMAEVESRYYGFVETTHQWQRDLGLRPKLAAPWAVSTVPPRPTAPVSVADADSLDAVPAAPSPTADLTVIQELPGELPSETPTPVPETRVIDLLPATVAPPTLRPPTATRTPKRATRTPRPLKATATPVPELPADQPITPPTEPPTAIAEEPAATAPSPVIEAANPPAAAPPVYNGAGPAPINPIIQDGALPGEGVWTADGFPAAPDGGSPAFWKTYLRPDAARPDALVYMVRVDLRRVRLHMVAGTKEPVSSLGTHGSGQVPTADQALLAGAFNGGWKSVHGNYGMRVNGLQIVPPNPRPDTATLALHADGRAELGGWKTLQNASDLVSYRQNCPLLIDNGTINVSTHITSTWGLSLLNEMYVWRSGVAMTPDGALIYAAGTPISADELAAAFQRAGANMAMQLDINSAWVQWLSYDRNSAGRPQATPLVPDMAFRRDQYLSPNDRDFFYLTWRTSAAR